MRKAFEYAVYRGDTFITLGTAIECAAFMGWKKAKHTQFFASPTYRNRVKDDGNGLYVFKLEDDDEETE
jgi:hypothetical protein